MLDKMISIFWRIGKRLLCFLLLFLFSFMKQLLLIIPLFLSFIVSLAYANQTGQIEDPILQYPQAIVNFFVSPKWNISYTYTWTETDGKIIIQKGGNQTNICTLNKWNILPISERDRSYTANTFEWFQASSLRGNYLFFAIKWGYENDDSLMYVMDTRTCKVLSKNYVWFENKNIHHINSWKQIIWIGIEGNWWFWISWSGIFISKKWSIHKYEKLVDFINFDFKKREYTKSFLWIDERKQFIEISSSTFDEKKKMITIEYILYTEEVWVKEKKLTKKIDLYQYLR